MRYGCCTAVLYSSCAACGLYPIAGVLLHLWLLLPGPQYVIVPEHPSAFIMHLRTLGHVTQPGISGLQPQLQTQRSV